MNGDYDRTPFRAGDANPDELLLLPVLSPDPARAEFVRAKCIAQLNRNMPRISRAAVDAGIVRRVLAPMVVFGFCALYVASLVAATLHLNGVIH